MANTEDEHAKNLAMALGYPYDTDTYWAFIHGYEKAMDEVNSGAGDKIKAAAGQFERLIRILIEAARATE